MVNTANLRSSEPSGPGALRSARCGTIFNPALPGPSLSDKEYEEWLRRQESKDPPAGSDDEPDDEPADDVPHPTVADASRLGNSLAGVIGGPGQIEMDAAADAEPVKEREAYVPDEAAMKEHDEAKAKQQDSVWYAVVGVAALFMSNFHWGLGVGGMFMVIYGTVRYVHFGRLAKKSFNPWDDAEIDAWEQEEMG